MTKERATAGSVAGGDRLRLFCALQLGDDTLDCLTEWQSAELGAGRVVPRENLHITLAFLGYRPAADCEGVAEELRAAAAQAGEIELSVRGYRETLGRDGHPRRSRRGGDQPRGGCPGPPGGPQHLPSGDPKVAAPRDGYAL